MSSGQKGKGILHIINYSNQGPLRVDGRYPSTVLAGRELSHVETKRPSGAFCLRQNAQRAALRAAGQATSGKKRSVSFEPRRARFGYHRENINRLKLNTVNMALCSHHEEL